MSELDEAKRQLEHAHAQLRARDLAEAQARIKAMNDAQQQQDESQKAERQKALDAEIEKTRQGSWVNALLKNAVATNPTAPFNLEAFEKAIPSKGWPAGDSPDNYHFAGQAVFGIDNDDVGSTVLGKLLKELEARKI